MGFFGNLLGSKEKAKPYIDKDGQPAKLDELLELLNKAKGLVNVHFSYLSIINQTYSRRKEPEVRELFKKLALEHIEKFSSIRGALLRDFNLHEDELGHYHDKEGRSSKFLHVPTFEYLATVYTEDGEYEKAIEVCEKAIVFGLHDWTKSDYQGRIERIKKKAQKNN